MERVGFFTTDLAEPGQALMEQVLAKKRFGGPAGLEICPAGMNPGIGPGIRRTQALNRIDIPSMWRALIRPPEDKKDGSVITILAPRGQPSAQVGPKLIDAGLGATNMQDGADGFDCSFPPDTPPDHLVGFAVQSLQAIGGLGVHDEWQWTVRAKGGVPS
jgi:hypothetical protein